MNNIYNYISINIPNDVRVSNTLYIAVYIYMYLTFCCKSRSMAVFVFQLDQHSFIRHVEVTLYTLSPRSCISRNTTALAFFLTDVKNSA